MLGIAITGGLGAGKTTIQRRLVFDHGFWTPRTITTRPAGSSEPELQTMNYDEFEEGVLAGAIVFPYLFGTAWYGWASDDFRRLIENDGRAVLNVRPYTALLIGAITPQVLPVWISAASAIRQQRREMRGELRDSVNLGDLRARRDAEDAPYEPLFQFRVESNSDTIARLLVLVDRLF